jgi:hypothetical protein
MLYTQGSLASLRDLSGNPGLWDRNAFGVENHDIPCRHTRVVFVFCLYAKGVVSQSPGLSQGREATQGYPGDDDANCINPEGVASVELNMPDRLKLNKDDLFPVQAFFNCIWDSSFVKIIDGLTKQIGAGVNEAHCEFPSDLDPGEPIFEGVRFSIFEDSIVISLSELREYLDIVCSQHVLLHPEDEGAINEMLRCPFDAKP